MVEVVPVVIGALGSVHQRFGRWIGKLGIPFNVGVMLSSCLYIFYLYVRQEARLIHQGTFCYCIV